MPPHWPMGSATERPSVKGHHRPPKALSSQTTRINPSQHTPDTPLAMRDAVLEPRDRHSDGFGDPRGASPVTGVAHIWVGLWETVRTRY